MIPLGERRIIFVGGKGGVGKTTTAGALALRFADAGRRTLVVSTDPAHSLGDLFDETIGATERELAPNLAGLELDPDAEADRFIEGVTANLRTFVHPEMYHEVERQMSLARSAPGSVEAAHLERVARIMTEDDARFERIVFDTAPTGQTLRLLALPEIMTAWTEGMLKHRERADELGRVAQRFGSRERDHIAFMESPGTDTAGDRFQRIRDVLSARRRLFHSARKLLLDGKQTAFLMVLNAERLPILESAKAVEALEKFGMQVAGIVVNRLLPAGEHGEFLQQRRERETSYLELIEEKFGRFPSVQVPMFARDVSGVDELRALGRALTLG